MHATPANFVLIFVEIFVCNLSEISKKKKKEEKIV